MALTEWVLSGDWLITRWRLPDSRISNKPLLGGQTVQLLSVLPATEEETPFVLHLDIGAESADLFVLGEGGNILCSFRRSASSLPSEMDARPRASGVKRMEWIYDAGDTQANIRGFSHGMTDIEFVVPLAHPRRPSASTSALSEPDTAGSHPADSKSDGIFLRGTEDVTIDWSRIWGSASSDTAEGVATFGTSIFVAGYTAGSFDGQGNAGSYDLFLSEFSEDGTRNWSRIWGSSGSDRGRGVAVSEDGAVYIAGNAAGTVHGQAYLAGGDLLLTKYDSAGTWQWTRLWGSTAAENGYGVVANHTSAVFVVGQTGGSFDGQSNSGGYDFCLSTFTPAGTRTWSRLRGSSQSEYPKAIAFDGESNIYITGSTFGEFDGQTNAGSGDAFLVKYNANGNWQWTRVWGSVSNDQALGIACDEDGGVYVAGGTEFAFHGATNIGAGDPFVTKFSSNGVHLWTRIWGSTDPDDAQGIADVSSDGIVVAGYSYGEFDGQTNAGQRDITLTRFLADGTRQWSRMWGSTDYDMGNAVASDGAGQFYVAGYANGAFGGQSHIGGSDAFLTRITEPLDITVLSIATAANSTFVAVGTTLSKSDFIILTEPAGFADLVQVTPLYFPTVSVYHVVASYGNSAATTTVTALEPSSILVVDNTEDLLSIPMTNGLPVYTTTFSRVTFEQLLMMANAQGSPLDPNYDFNWSDWSNALEVARSAKTRGILDVFRGLDWADIKARIADPVNVVQGNFYVDEIDLSLPAPNPFEIRRSFSSENLAPSDLGTGWHLSRNYYLFVNNAVFDLNAGVSLPTNAEVRVSEPDGSAVVYSRRTSTPANVLLVNAGVSASDSNAPLNNINANGIGARANLMNNRVEYVPSNRSFYVYNGQGSVRRFDWQEFGATNDPAYRKRPYLVYEQRPNGNRISFTYTADGLPSTIRATDNTGATVFNTVSFQYNAESKLWRLTASDGRTVSYYYDNFGDLSRVVRPDGTEVTYSYEHFPIQGTPTNYSSHRITRVQKPDNRILENEYFQIGETVDGEVLTNGHYLVGRVKLQKVTQTSPSALITNAWFSYSVVTNSGDPAAGSGFTEVYDALKNKTVYRFDTNRHVTAIERYAKARDGNGNPIMDGTNFTYTLHATERRYWNGVNLVRTALENPSSDVVFNWGATYDDRGNLLSEKIAGNLSGNFSGTLQFDTNGLPLNGESASTLYTYTYNPANTNDAQNLMTSIIRPNASVLRFVYASATNSSLTARYFCQPDGDTNAFNNSIYSREFYEYNANQVLTKRITDDGTASNKTDLAGVTQRRINETTPGAAVPTYGLPVTVYDKFYNGASDQTLLRHDLAYDARGNPTNVVTYNSTNGLQFSTAFGYDLMNRQTLAVDANGGRTAYTYDNNGNLTTIDGPLTNLTDTSTFSFDYANRLISTVRQDGYGNVLTNTFAYDEYGNELARTNLHGQVTRSYYDDLHRRTAFVLPIITTAESNNVAPTILSGFDIFDNTAALMDANSNLTTYAYNARKQRTAAYYPDNTQETFTYDTAGRLIESVAPNGSYTEYDYDLLDRVTNRSVSSDTGTLLARYSTAYNAFNVTALTDANTNTTSFAYDWAGRLTYEYGPGATATRAQTQYLYNDLSQVGERRVWFGTNATDYSATVYGYDNLGRVTSEVVQSSGAVVLLKTEYGYDLAGNRTLVRTFPTAASGGATTVSEYDALNNIVAVTDALTNRTTIVYDYSGSGLKSTVTDALTNKTITILDALGRQTTVERRNATNGLLRLTEYRHDPNGNRTRAIETVIGSNHVITAGWTYDGRNRVLTMTEALGSADERTTRYFYNDVGQLYSQKNPNGVEFFHFYDSRGRVENLVSGDNSIRYRYTYDANNNIVSVQDIVTGQTTTREFDENNRVKKETQATGFVLEYAYDRAGRETRALLPGSNAVDYAYNAAFLTAVRRMTNVTSLGAAGSLAYQHSYTSNDLAGNILAVTLASGQAQTFQTDRLNRRTLISGPAWTQTVASGTSGYDPAGNLKNFTVNDPGSTLNFVHTYDGLYQLASEAGVVSRTYAHDSIGNRLSLNSGATAYTYNHLNELLLQNAATNVLTGTIRVPVSGLYGPTKLSEAVSSVTLKLDAGSPVSAALTNGTWEYVNGGLKGLNVPVDGANHTIAATATTTNSLTNAKTVTVSYASTTITGYRFDRNGNLVQQIAHGSNAVVWSYTHDALNRMVMATKACPTCDTLTVRFAYDPFNRRISKTVSSGATTSLVQRFVWDRQSEIGAADSSGNLLQLRFLGRGLGNEVGAAVAVEIRTNAASAWVAYVPIHDHRGNVVVLINRASGALAEYCRYDAFGNAQIYNPAHSLLSDSAVGNPWRFASKRTDMETGFVYFGRRLYDPQAGRFVSADPLGFLDGPNRYLFAQATPLVMTDFDGLLARQLGHNVAGWADANFSLVNDDWRYIPTMNYLDWSGWSDYLPAAIQNMLFAPIWNLVAGTANPMIDVHIYGSDSEYAPFMFVMMHPEIGMQIEYTRQAMGPLIRTSAGRVTQAFRRSSTADDVVVDPLMQVGRHGDMPTPRPDGYQSHHGVNTVWMKENTPGYIASDAPAVLMKNDPSHNATRDIFNRIRSEIAGRQGVSIRDIDWSQVSPGTAWRLAEEQFQAANVAPVVQEEYFRQFNAYLESLR